MKKLSLVISLIIFVQCFCFAQLKTNNSGVTATLQKDQNGKIGEGFLLENTNNYPVEVTYTIKFVRQFVAASAKSDKETTEKQGTVILAPTGTPKVKGEKTARYWVEAGDGHPVIFSETTVNLIVKKANSY
jgi:hypothetical protein